MKEEAYEEFMKSAPPQDSPRFITFLRNNNEVIAEDPHWLIIVNLKRDRPECRWYTAFAKRKRDIELHRSIFLPFKDWTWLKHPRSIQSIPGRFHIHLIDGDPKYL